MSGPCGPGHEERQQIQAGASSRPEIGGHRDCLPAMEGKGPERMAVPGGEMAGGLSTVVVGEREQARQDVPVGKMEAGQEAAVPASESGRARATDLSFAPYTRHHLSFPKTVKHPSPEGLLPRRPRPLWPCVRPRHVGNATSPAPRRGRRTFAANTARACVSAAFPAR
jgi:hypothetical protein